MPRMEKDVKITGEVNEEGVPVPAPREGWGQVGNERYAFDVAILKHTLEEKTRTATSNDGDEQASNRVAASHRKKLERIGKRKEKYESQKRQRVVARGQKDWRRRSVERAAAVAQTRISNAATASTALQRLKS